MTMDIFFAVGTVAEVMCTELLL